MLRLLGFVLVTLVIAGCSSTKETSKAPGTAEATEATEDLKKYEGTFRPSDYEEQPERKTEHRDTHVNPDSAAAALEGPAVASEPVAGFRVQIFSSANIDQAKAKQSEAQSMFPAEWFYLEYDQPTYKIRAGNFLSRFEADRFGKILVEKGFPEAWTVPAKVFKNPPPPPSKEDTENPK